MKRHFMESLKALCAGVMTLCVASLSFVSCYDDSALNQKIDDIDARLKVVEEVIGQLDALSARVDALYTLKFQVTTDMKLQYSFDNGTTWVETGVTLAKECTCPVVESCKCAEVKLVDNGDSVTISVGDQSFTIEKPEVVKFEILSGKVFFGYSEEKDVVLSLSGIKTVSVAKAPKGWAAEIDDNKIVVTSPAEENYDAAQSGVIEVWAVSNEGMISVGTVGVVVSNQPCVISVSGDQVTFTIAEDPDYGSPYTIYYGVSTSDKYNADAEATLKAIKSYNFDALQSNWNYESTLTISLKEALGEEPVPGKTYIIWSVTPVQVREGWSMTDVTTIDDFIKYYYSPTKVEITKEESWNDVKLSVEVIGADEYLAGWLPKESYDPEWFNIQEYLAAAPGTMWGPIGQWYTYSGKWEGSLKDFCSPEYSNSIEPNTEYVIFVLPLNPLKSIDEYTNADATFVEVKTDALQPGGTASAKVNTTAEGAIRVSALYPEVTTTGAVVTYFEWFDAEKLQSFANEELLIVDYMLNESYYVGMRDESKFIASYTNCSPDTDYTLYLIMVDKDGKYSVQKEVVRTGKLPLSDDIAVTIDKTNTVVNTYSVSLKLNIVGEFDKIVFWIAEPNQYWSPTTDEFELNVCSTEGEWYAYDYVNASDIKDGVYEVTNLEPETTYDIFVMGYTADKKYSHADKFTCTPELIINNVVTENFTVAPELSFNTPEYSATEVYDYGYYHYSDNAFVYYYYNTSYNVNPNGISSLKVTAVNTLSEDITWNTLTTVDKVKMVVLNKYPFNASQVTETTTVDYSANECVYSSYGDPTSLSPVLIAVWQDADGNYCYMEQSLESEFAAMRSIMNQNRAEELVDGKQWLFDWKGYGAQMGLESMPSVLDFGVTAEGTVYSAINYEAIYGAEAAGIWMEAFNGIYKQVTATDATSGYVTLYQNDYTTGELVEGLKIEYNTLTKTTCAFNCPDFFMNNEAATVSDTLIPVTPNGVAM